MFHTYINISFHFYLIRWKNWWIRSAFTLVMIGGFGIIAKLGPMAILFLVILLNYCILTINSLFLRSTYTERQEAISSMQSCFTNRPIFQRYLYSGIYILFPLRFSYCLFLSFISGLFFQIFVIQVKCYHEIISIGHIQYKKSNLPWFRTLSW